LPNQYHIFAVCQQQAVIYYNLNQILGKFELKNIDKKRRPFHLRAPPFMDKVVAI